MRKVVMHDDYEITVDVEQSGPNWTASYAIHAGGELIKRRRGRVIVATSRIDAAYIALSEAKSALAKKSGNSPIGGQMVAVRSGASRQAL